MWKYIHLQMLKLDGLAFEAKMEPNNLNQLEILAKSLIMAVCVCVLILKANLSQ